MRFERLVSDPAESYREREIVAGRTRQRRRGFENLGCSGHVAKVVLRSGQRVAGGDCVQRLRPQLIQERDRRFGEVLAACVITLAPHQFGGYPEQATS